MGRLPPVPKSFTPVIAERRLVVETGRKKRNVRVQLGTPTRDVSTVRGFDWRCPVRISGASRHRRILHAFGVDSLQSLVHALKLIENELATFGAQSDARVLWLGEPWHGFPHIELALPTYNVV